MAEVSAHSFRTSGLYDTAQYVLKHGEEVSPRGQLTKEVRGFTLRLQEPADSLLTNAVRPSFNKGIAAAEAAQLIGGISDPALMVRISKNFAAFQNGGAFLGAYGPRVRTQLPQLLKVLQKDTSSRQALIQIWRPQDDLWAAGAKDIPCTTSLQFFLRDGLLHCHTYMRSNDVWWGLSYDAFQFTQLQCTLANALEAGVGEYVHTVGSMHIYERDFDKIDGIAHPSSNLVTSDPETLVYGFGELYFDLEGAMDDAAGVVTGEGERNPKDVSLEWYWDVLEKYHV